MLDFLLQDLYRHPVIVGAGIAYIVVSMMVWYWAQKDRDEAADRQCQIIDLLRDIRGALQ